MLLNLPSIFATATSHVFEIKNNHTANSILNHPQCWNWLNWRWKITLNIVPIYIATFFCRFYHVQSSAERPWLDMLARSDPTIDGQMIYIEERLWELITAQTTIEHWGPSQEWFQVKMLVLDMRTCGVWPTIKGSVFLTSLFQRPKHPITNGFWNIPHKVCGLKDR